VFPIWFGFKGGKGGATAVGVLLYFAPLVALLVVGVWLVLALATGYVGLATMAAALGAAVFIALLRMPDDFGLLVFACTTAALIVYTHRGNIRRMLDRTEPRFRRMQGSK
jgi:glycerol-3-phosphate acyltransferase PlsY